MGLKICVVGAGYVGLPLAMAFSEKFDTTVYMHSKEHVEELRNGVDRTENFSKDDLNKSSLKISPTIVESDIYIVTVPTPVDEEKNPDLSYIKSATSTVGSVLKKDDIVVYESTVFIGCTEEYCVPILEETSSLKYNIDFFCGYSPERVNPTDTEHTVKNIVKIVSGSTDDTVDKLELLYKQIIEAGLYRAPSIKVAEASKLLENIQRDVNIALINELSSLYNKLGIVTSDVIDAASTKWNFNRYYPGLVGGHCIGVDPYYLLYNAKENGIDMPIISQTRVTNNSMPFEVVKSSERLMHKKGLELGNSRVLLLGLAFKENCNDTRNSQSAVIYDLIKSKALEIDVVDPCVRYEETKKRYGINILKEIPKEKRYELIIVAVAHNEFKKVIWNKLKSTNAVLYDVKGIVANEDRDLHL